jgi:hypothetical protein
MARSLLFKKLIRALQQARRDNLKAAGKPLPLTKEQFSWTRRRFIRSAALAGGTVIATTTLSRAQNADSMQLINSKKLVYLPPYMKLVLDWEGGCSRKRD